MIRRMLFKAAIVALGFGLNVAAVPAHADSVLVSWFTVTPGALDFTGGSCCSTDTGSVLGTLGPNGMPVASGTPPLLFTNGFGELQWWTPTPGLVQATGSSVLSVPINQNMFIPNGTGGNNSTGFQTAIVQGILTVASGTATINFGGDDDVFLALNNQIVSQLGGVHAGADANYDVGAGTYLLTLFYADRQQVAANLHFSVEGGTINAVPEPSTWAMMILGFAGVGFMAYRRKAQSAVRLA